VSNIFKRCSDEWQVNFLLQKEINLNK